MLKFLVLLYRKIRFCRFRRPYLDIVKTTLFLEKNPRDDVSFSDYLSKEFNNDAKRKD